MRPRIHICVSSEETGSTGLFSTTTSALKIISQVMLMSSLKKYFSYGIMTACGIPGLHMKGTPEDWEKLNTKFIELEAILEPVKKELRLKRWFDNTRIVFTNLNKMFIENPVSPEVIQWWSRILSWKEDYGSLGRMVSKISWS